MHFLPNQMPAKISCYWVLRPSQQIMSTSMMDSENRIYAIFNVLLFITLVQNWHSNLAATTLPHIADNPPDDKASLLFKDIVVLLHHNMVSGHTLLTPQCMAISQNMGCLCHSKGMQPTMPKCPLLDGKPHHPNWPSSQRQHHQFSWSNLPPEMSCCRVDYTTGILNSANARAMLKKSYVGKHIRNLV